MNASVAATVTSAVNPSATYRACVGCAPNTLHDESTLSLCLECGSHICADHDCECRVEIEEGIAA